jgi:hypothetical protein
MPELRELIPLIERRFLAVVVLAIRVLILREALAPILILRAEAKLPIRQILRESLILRAKVELIRG